MLKAAWDEVRPLTIKNCFSKAGFFCSSEPEIELIEPPEDWTTISNGLLYEEFLSIDANLSTFGQITEEEIVSKIQNKKICESESSGDERKEENVEEKLPTSGEAYNYLQKTNKFIEAQEDVPDNVFAASHTIENFLLNCKIQNRKQRKITDFFSS